MGKLFKIAVVAGAVAAGTAAIFALKKRKELEDYDYEELDDDFRKAQRRLLTRLKTLLRKLTVNLN